MASPQALSAQSVGPESGADTPVARRVIAVLTVVVLTAITAVILLAPDVRTGGRPTVLATLNAVLNASAGCFLIAGYVFVRLRQLRAHRVCMMSATGLSSIFLVTYLLHHAQVGSVPYGGTGLLRTVYFSILIPHVILAALILPMALLTIYRGWTGRLKAHKKVAVWTLPLWLYVSASGVCVYLMLYYT